MSPKRFPETYQVSHDRPSPGERSDVWDDVAHRGPRHTTPEDLRQAIDRSSPPVDATSSPERPAEDEENTASLLPGMTSEERAEYQSQQRARLAEVRRIFDNPDQSARQ
jgi:hypothetical protein